MEDRLPFLQPHEDPYTTWQIIVGIAVLVLGFAGAVAYMLWKLPRADDLTNPDRAPDEDRVEPKKP